VSLVSCYLVETLCVATHLKPRQHQILWSFAGAAWD